MGTFQGKITTGLQHYDGLGDMCELRRPVWLEKLELVAGGNILNSFTLKLV